jgi:hypothetical protein
LNRSPISSAARISEQPGQPRRKVGNEHHAVSGLARDGLRTVPRGARVIGEWADDRGRGAGTGARRPEAHARKRQLRTVPSSKTRVMFGPPPANAAASASLAPIADRILLSGGPDEVREHLRTLLPTSTRQASRTSWALRLSRSTTPCSEGLRAGYTPLLEASPGRAAGHSPSVLLSSVRSAGDPNTSRHSSPEDWYERHFKPLTGVNPMFTRRTAVLRLVQMVAGGSLGEAARFLGIATTRTTWQGRIYSGAGHVHSNAPKQPDPLAFEAALEALAGELDEPATPLINYQQRRQALETWSIDKPPGATSSPGFRPSPAHNTPNLATGNARSPPSTSGSSSPPASTTSPQDPSRPPSPTNSAGLEAPAEHDLAPAPERPLPLHQPPSRTPRPGRLARQDNRHNAMTPTYQPPMTGAV